MQRNVNPEQVRADAVAALAVPGERRRALVAELAELDNELRPIVLAAVSAGVPLPRVRDLTGIAPNTVRAWRRKAADDPPARPD